MELRVIVGEKIFLDVPQQQSYEWRYRSIKSCASFHSNNRIHSSYPWMWMLGHFFMELRVIVGEYGFIRDKYSLTCHSSRDMNGGIDPLNHANLSIPTTGSIHPIPGCGC